MYSYLMNTICRTGIFIICAQVLVHLRPKGFYEKYLKMLMSAMILMQLFLPVSTFFTGEGEKSLAARVAWFEEQLTQSMEQMERNHAEGESILEQMTLEEVQNRIAIKAQEREAAQESAAEAAASLPETELPEDAPQNMALSQDMSPVQIAPVEKIEIHMQSGEDGQKGQEKQSGNIRQEGGLQDDIRGE
ncbi:MAG: stage III sporulation protein AF [Acetatifactor sp.]|nr:stage III sporulation protein AF [Acetatifactor sp.]